MRWTFFVALCLATAYAAVDDDGSAPATAYAAVDDDGSAPATAYATVLDDDGSARPPLTVPRNTVMAPLHENGKIIPNEYIVVFKDDVTDDVVKNHMTAFWNLVMKSESRIHRVLNEYHIGAFRGYAAHMNDEILDNIRLMREVSFVESNQEVKAFDLPLSQHGPPPLKRRGYTPCLAQGEGSWGLGRTTSRDPLPRNIYSYHRNGQGQEVDVYVIDTGIEIHHYDFGGRAFWGVDYVENPSPQTDLNGHGTHVAGTIMGDTFGIAKKAIAIAVRVLNANGRGSKSGVIAGIQWVGYSYEHRKKKSVCNMSLGGGKSSAENRAVAEVVKKGVHFAVAAGNSNSDACNYSPASEPMAVTVGASDKRDKFAVFSNWGECVDIIAPGVHITSAWLNWGERTISGTSMAAPHVAGVMAKILSQSHRDITPQEMENLLIKTSTKDKIMNVPGVTPNRLLFKQCT